MGWKRAMEIGGVLQMAEKFICLHEKGCRGLIDVFLRSGDQMNKMLTKFMKSSFEAHFKKV